MFFSMKPIVGLLALSMVAVAAPAEHVERSAADSLQKRGDCFGGSYGTCLTEYFELFCLVQCVSDNLIAEQDCKNQCDDGASSYCEEEC
ncbi:hypothetical protein ASPZODRAFT_131675 [Penicilliopsis zonata CBS 506.65]|uniref:Uncharacterized protein n=1 Tax=Penicilliopsis zonata CBS 506.65 TaxID=1073090 RepID=A0A1L9SLF5_9EURO|nr:hypothetical protein ASPZODRAFT_131675 [Penicilliopsis zonata CBS 506.65]OJJ48025.1 hypothetical protein ASPZODRAFT_131675 [Penicilliopsis zonata CBS 506.65]